MHDSENMTPKKTMTALEEKDGKEFDQAFLEHMVMHHKSGIEMARLAAKKADQNEIKEMSERMATQQQKEVREMEEMMAS